MTLTSYKWHLTSGICCFNRHLKAIDFTTWHLTSGHIRHLTFDMNQQIFNGQHQQSKRIHVCTNQKVFVIVLNVTIICTPIYLKHPPLVRWKDPPWSSAQTQKGIGASHFFLRNLFPQCVSTSKNELASGVGGCDGPRSPNFPQHWCL